MRSVALQVENKRGGRFHSRHDASAADEAADVIRRESGTQRIHQLVADWGAEKSPELVEEMIMTALKMARDGMGTADLKLMNRSLKEMRYAAKVFASYREYPKGVRLRLGADVADANRSFRSRKSSRA